MENAKKAAIVTLTVYSNYGNRLQNLALEVALKNIGVEASTLKYLMKPKKQSNIIAIRLKRFFSSSAKTKILKIASRFNKNSEYLKNVNASKQRIIAFKDFTNKHINEIEFNHDSIDTFDYFIVGSDQVWNPVFINEGKDSTYFLQFAPSDKRIAYAASFGISEIPNHLKETYKKWIDEIPFVSVRENQGRTIIKELSNRDVQVTCDPVVLLTDKEWGAFAKKPDYLGEDEAFIFTYFLGKKHPKAIKELDKLKSEGYKILNFGDSKDAICYKMGPSEFLYALINAKMILTNSFHGSMLSVILKKPFTVFEHVGSAKAAHSRIDTMLKTYKLGDRLFDYENNCEIDYFNADFSHVDEILISEKQKAIDFLKTAMNMCETGD